MPYLGEYLLMFLKLVWKLRFGEFYLRRLSKQGLAKMKSLLFSELDAVPPIMPQLDALTISMIIANHKVKQAYMDNRAAVNILFLDNFQKLGLNRDQLKPCLVV